MLGSWAERGAGLVFREGLDAARQPLRPRLAVGDVLAGGGVLLGDAIERRELPGPQSEQRRPQAPMHERALAVGQPAREHVG